MSFFAGAIIGKAILDTTAWVAGGKTMKNSVGGLGKAFATVGKAAIGLGVALGAGLAKSVMAANEWQKEFSNVSTLVDETQVNVQDMAKELLLMDSQLGSSTELTRGLYQALSASVEPGKAIEFVGEAARFAKAALVDTNAAVDVITTGLNAYGLEADDAGRISDVLFTTIKNGKVTGDELASTIGQVIPLAANMNLSFENLGASVAEMTKQGVSSAEATTQLNAVMTSLLKPSSDLKQAMTDAGFATGEAVTSSDNFQEALQEVIAQTDGSQEALAQLFPNVRALRGALALTGEGASGFADTLTEMENSTGATNTAFEKQEKTFDTLKNTLGKGQIIVGNIAKTFVDELAVGANEAANSMIQFLISSQGAEIVSEIIGRIAAGFEAFTIIIQPLVDTILNELGNIWDNLTEKLDTIQGNVEDATGAFNVFTVAAQLVSSIFRLVSTVVNGAITNIGNLIIAIQESGGVIGSFFDFLTGKKTWEEVEAQAGRAVTAFADLGTGFVTSFTDVIDVMIGETTQFQQKVNEQTTQLDIKYKTTFESVKANAKDGYDSLLTGQTEMSEAMLENYQLLHDGIVEINGATEENVKVTNDNIEEDTAETTERMAELWTDLQNVIETGFAATFTALGEGLLAAEEGSKSLGEVFGDAIKDMISKALEALGKWLFVEGVAALVPGLTFNPVAAAGYFAASALAFTSAGVVRALQAGGPVAPNEPVVVGEAGPELFIPTRGGAVIPNNQMQNFGNITITNYNTIRNAEDIELLNRKIAFQLQSSRKGMYQSYL
jgi:TP901 family phage tail tape measure protein